MAIKEATQSVPWRNLHRVVLYQVEEGIIGARRQSVGQRAWPFEWQVERQSPVRAVMREAISGASREAITCPDSAPS